MTKITDLVEIPENIANIAKEKIVSVEAFERISKDYFQQDVSILINIILAGSINLKASDIHLEPTEEYVKMRVRLDGMLQDVLNIPLDVYHMLLSRIKLLAGLKLNVYDKPQDGSFSILVSTGKEAKEIEIRTSSLPADYGETIVMRILNPESLKSIADLGLRQDLLETFKNQIKKPNGMIIVTGPTGSGKTTTLYAFLSYIRKPEIKIVTIEDPIEYRLDGISQTEVHAQKGYTFASGLKAIVRQDPDVILVGEIRDLETAEIAIQSALTGHLVLSTLHTNDAAGAIPRLTSLGAKAMNIAPAINIAVAQRLVRRICPFCGTEEEPTKEELEKIQNAINAMPEQLRNEVEKKRITVKKPKKCKSCNYTGYKGRIALFEAICMDNDLRDLILKNPSVPEIIKMAKEKGFVSMYQDGIIKVLEGVTTIEEIERVAME
ncbi:MAG: GspE/PulE family protein [Candidatus Pacebacteria bacterium]|nr:GspE/PulE family protein [Candidatus Paceibacterota bacterium]